MNLFTYLLSKKGKNSLVHKGDLFAYLLGKQTPKEVKTATGTTISITDATKAKIVSLTLSKESMQDGTPTPESPVEIKTVTGYRNLFDGAVFKANYIVNNQGAQSYNGAYNLYKITTLIPGKTYTVHFKSIDTQPRSNRYCFYDSNDGFISYTEIPNVFAGAEATKTFTVPTNTSYVLFHTGKLIENLQIVEGNDVLPYVPYGTNWVYTKVTNGTDTNYYTIPLNNNEIVGIGDYKDELIIDSDGHCYLNKKVGKILLNGTETWSKSSNTNIDRYVMPQGTHKNYIHSLSNYFKYVGATYNIGFYNNVGTQLIFNFASYGTTTLLQWKEWLSEHNVICYQPLKEEQLIDLNYTIDIRLFNGVNNISNSDDMDMTLKYY